MERRAAILAVLTTTISALRSNVQAQPTKAQQTQPSTGRGAFVTGQAFNPSEMKIHIGAPTFAYVYTDGTRTATVTVKEILDALGAK